MRLVVGCWLFNYGSFVRSFGWGGWGSLDGVDGKDQKTRRPSRRTMMWEWGLCILVFFFSVGSNFFRFLFLKIKDKRINSSFFCIKPINRLRTGNII